MHKFFLNGVCRCKAIRIRQLYYNGRLLTTCGLQFQYFEGCGFETAIVECIIRPKGLIRESLKYLTGSYRHSVPVHVKLSLRYYGSNQLLASIWHIDYKADIDEGIMVMDFRGRIAKILGDGFYEIDISTTNVCYHFYFRIAFEDKNLDLAANDVIEGRGSLRKDKLNSTNLSDPVYVVDVNKIRSINGTNIDAGKQDPPLKNINAINPGSEITGGFDDSFFNKDRKSVV
jgi:hypothetical protein